MRNDRELFFRYFCMSPERLDHLLTLEKKDTAFRSASNNSMLSGIW